MISNKQKMLKIIRHSSHMAIKKSQNGEQCQIIQIDDMKKRKNTFWMKKVVGSNGGQNIPMNYSRPSSKTRRALSSKLITQTEDSRDKIQNNTQSFQESNSKFNLMLKYQKQIIQEIRLGSQERNNKVFYSDKLYTSLTKILNKVISTPIMDHLPSLNALIINHIEQTTFLFKQISQECLMLRQKKNIRFNDEMQKMSKQNKQIIEAYIKICQENKVLRNINQQKLQQCQQVNSVLKYIDISYEKVLIENYVEDFQKNNNHTKYNILLLGDEFWKKMLTSLTDKHYIQPIFSLKVQKFLLCKFTQSTQNLKILNTFQNLKHTTNSNRQLTLKRIANFCLMQFSVFEISTKLSLFDFKIFKTINKIVQFWLTKVRLSKLNKVQNTVSLQEAIILFNKSTFLTCYMGNLYQKIKVWIQLLSKVRMEDGELLKQQYIDSVKNLQSIDSLPDQKTRCSTAVNQQSGIITVRNRRLINCMNLIEPRLVSNLQKQKNIQSINQDVFDFKISKMQSIMLKKVDMMLCIYYYIKKQLQKMEGDLMCEMIKKKKESILLIEKYWDQNLTDNYNFIRDQKRRQQVFLLVQTFENSRSYRQRIVSKEETNLQLVKFMTYQYFKNVFLQFLQIESDFSLTN